MAVLCAALLSPPSLADAPADRPAPEWQGGFITGYNLGQNGQGWPQPWREPLSNYNRGGFYVSQTRLGLRLPFDSTFKAVFSGNIIFAEVQDAYLEKQWGAFRVKAGKFRGAGLKSGSGTDEFELTTVQRPRYARFWNFYKKLHNFRDFGIQGETEALGGRLKHRLFLHNANGENVFNDEPSFNAGATTQALGLDYAADFRVSPYTTVGGHLGALANRQWDEFMGSHDFWEVQYWFKSNPIVDVSFYHQMDFPRFHLVNEVLTMWNRTLLSPADGSSMITWGASTLARFEQTLRWTPFLGYEFFDHSNGLYPDDAVQMFKVGAEFRPSPVRYPGLRTTAQYVRALEEGGRNSVGNDILYAQLWMVF